MTITPLQLETDSATETDYYALNAPIKYWNNNDRIVSLLLESKDLFIQWVLHILSRMALLLLYLSDTELDSQTLRLAAGQQLNSCT